MGVELPGSEQYQPVKFVGNGKGFLPQGFVGTLRFHKPVQCLEGIPAKSVEPLGCRGGHFESGLPVPPETGAVHARMFPRKVDYTSPDAVHSGIAVNSEWLIFIGLGEQYPAIGIG